MNRRVNERGPWPVRWSERPPVAPHAVWSTRPILVSTLAVLLMAPSAIEIAGFVEMAHESPMRADGPGMSLPALPFLFCGGGPVALACTVFAVLPALSAARWAGRRYTGRHAWWWVPVVAGCGAAVVAPWPAVAGGGPAVWWWTWLGGTVALSAVALLTRWALTRERPYRTVVGAGALSAAGVVALGALVYGTGLVDEYAPPRVRGSDLAGTWSDGRGGTLRLGADGRAVAVGTWGDRAGEPEGRCAGSGTWRFTPDDSTWLQAVDIAVGDCWPGRWTLGGTAADPKLNYEYGDPDSPDWYVLTR
ncbi:hypothetical protein E2C00_23205 [Streptomyces sp. WAC05374]|uniref:hypothetical protein n=1 Tax=Streptomyces sp. WAC05374 TaxID=2487420 RepID=UPI000F86BFBC|nr:hypothetical protein [Streptomyces sp. WAC05374]RST10598.1 hypothetical protein EF905_26955 [Streptomyces sp. WAC05374]TDF46160.1 hypothetical protein E2B92_12210 [Streptomyces sp. WAC05374]TDF52406.1 hypothetical protein E2C00_23205 [Streptomyces sp. WAC05374]TDF58367.1 hypothetical protein E2C02_07595 [Streptomyces sp. WAC05374]